MTLLRDNPPDALELWNKETGETAPVVPRSGEWPDILGNYAVWKEPIGCAPYFKEDGSPVSIDLFPNWIMRLKQDDAIAALRAEFSDVVKGLLAAHTAFDKVDKAAVKSAFSRFILPDPVDPLVEVFDHIQMITLPADEPWVKGMADAFKAELVKRGLKIVEDDQ